MCRKTIQQNGLLTLKLHHPNTLVLLVYQEENTNNPENPTKIFIYSLFTIIATKYLLTQLVDKSTKTNILTGFSKQNP